MRLLLLLWAWQRTRVRMVNAIITDSCPTALVSRQNQSDAVKSPVRFTVESMLQLKIPDVRSVLYIGIKKKNRGYCESKRRNTRICWMKLMISFDIILMTLRHQINPKQNTVQSDVWPQLQHEMVKDQVKKCTASITDTTTVNCQPRKAQFEHCSQLFCF